MNSSPPLPQQLDKTIKPLPDLESVEVVRNMLLGKPRDLLLFDLLVQTGTTVKNLLGIRVGQVTDLGIGDRLPLTGSSTRVSGNPVMNQVIMDSLTKYLTNSQAAADDYLFPSRKGAGPLNLSSVSHLVKSWLHKAGFQELSGTKSLQKTWETLFRPQEAAEGPLDSTHNIKPINAATIQELVYKELYRNIVSGLIAPGETLKTDKIAKKMQVSLMPVREAVHRLREGGFISNLKSRGGFVVNELSLHNLEEITKIRLCLEPMAAGQAALVRSDESIQHLESIHQELLDSISLYSGEVYLSINRKFHQTIYRQADMPILYQIINSLWGRVSPYLYMLMREPVASDLYWTVHNHEQMLKGMRDKDPQKVVENLKADLNGAAKLLRVLFTSKGHEQ
jgi:DNA-binding GntR family transcriptional regulator